MLTSDTGLFLMWSDITKNSVVNVKKEMYDLNLHQFIFSLMRQKRHDFLRTNQIRKKMALGNDLKQVGDITAADEFMTTIQTICNGNANNADHLCLQVNIMKRQDIIQICNKQQMHKILNRYGFSCKSSANKK